MVNNNDFLFYLQEIIQDGRLWVYAITNITINDIEFSVIISKDAINPMVEYTPQKLDQHLKELNKLAFKIKKLINCE